MKIHSEQELLDFGQNFAKQNTQLPLVIELIGDVGAGKTTFTRGLAKGLGIKKPITSPSFTISKAYALPKGGNLIHYDFYRLPDPGLMADDLSENLNTPENIIVIEWSDSVQRLLPADHLTIKFNKNNDGSREIVVKKSRDGASRGLPEATTEDEGASPVTTGASDPSPESAIRLFLDTSTPETILKLNDQEYRYNFDHDLAEKLLKFIHDKLQDNQLDFRDITKITFMSGPGSFTGLRIGAAIVNTLASELNIPLYDHHDQKHQIILPDYGREANITKPKK